MQDLFLVLITSPYNTIQALHPSLKWILKYFTADYRLYIPMWMRWRAHPGIQEAATDGEERWHLRGDHGTHGVLNQYRGSCQVEAKKKSKIPRWEEYVSCDTSWRLCQILRVFFFFRQMLLAVPCCTCSISAKQEAFLCTAFYWWSFSFCFQAVQALMGAVDACTLSVTSCPCVSSSHAHF